MPDPVLLLCVPGLREKDVERMPHLRELTAGGEIAPFVPSFPAVTCPVQANLTTGKLPAEHGVVANGFYWREQGRVEMWTSPNDCIQQRQIWDLLSHAGLTSAVWFLLHSKGCEAEYVCTPAPIHNPDGSESLWCYTRPLELYGELRDQFGHFPLQHFWGPMTNIRSTAWIADSAVAAARRWQPDLFVTYLPHLDYAAQRHGPDSPEADQAVAELDEVLARLGSGMQEAYGAARLLWLVVGEYAITPVDHVCYPNRILREAGLLAVRETAEGEYLDPMASQAWALVDHQFSHVFVANGDPAIAAKVVELFRGQSGIAEVLQSRQLVQYGLCHPRSGDVVLVSAPNSWQAYYYWLSDAAAPPFARTVDIHRKPGYDPVELHFDPATRSIPLDATRIRGSHGAPVVAAAQRSVVVASQPGLFASETVADCEIFDVLLRHFGLQVS